MRVAAASLLMTGLLSLGACTNSEHTSSRHSDADSPAGKLGQAAYHAKVDLKRAAAEADRKLQKAARDARAGWQQAERTDSKSHQ
jgi:hypothetical protein